MLHHFHVSVFTCMFVIRDLFRINLKSFYLTRSPNLIFRRFFVMKLYTDKYNPVTLRVLVADKLAGTKLIIEHVKRNGKVSLCLLLIH